MNGASGIEFTGTEDCPCIDASDIMSSLDRPCFFKDETTGDNTSVGVKSKTGVCYPITYGSHYCMAHDLKADPLCNVEPNATDSIQQPPDYCHDSWCFVDLDKCMGSEEIVTRDAVLFPKTAGLYYSYSTCNSSAAAYEDYITTLPLVNRTLRITIDGSWYPHHFKRDKDGNVAKFNGEEYYDNSIPFKGSFINYMNSVVRHSNNIKGVKYVAKSKGSEKLFPHSSSTAAVNDVRAGLSDMAVGSFWVTAERLQLTTFTTPLVMDKIVLVVDRPRIGNSFASDTAHLFQPFEPGLWYVLLLSIFIASVLGIWFKSPTANQSLAWLKFRKVKWREASFRRRAVLVFRLLIDGILEKVTYFCNGEVDMDPGASLPSKLLMTGFAFLILISVSAYVANLAAFLTLSGVDDDSFINTMKKAIDLQVPICANSVLRNELDATWPKANFVFIDLRRHEHRDIEIDYYDQGKCKALAVSSIDRYTDDAFQNLLCERNLVTLEELVLELPIAFAVDKDLAAGFSSYLMKHKNAGYKYLGFEDIHYRAANKCDLTDLLGLEDQGDEYSQISLGNMAFAFLFFGFFASVAFVVQLYDCMVHNCYSTHGSTNIKHDKKDSSSSSDNLLRVFCRPLQFISWMKSHPSKDNNVSSTKSLKSRNPPKEEQHDYSMQSIYATGGNPNKSIDSREMQDCGGDRSFGSNQQGDDNFRDNDEIEFQVEENDKFMGSFGTVSSSMPSLKDKSPPVDEVKKLDFADEQSYRELFESTMSDFESTLSRFEHAFVSLKKLEQHNKKNNNFKEHKC